MREALTRWLYWYEKHTDTLTGRAYDEAVELAAVTRALLYAVLPQDDKDGGSWRG